MLALENYLLSCGGSGSGGGGGRVGGGGGSDSNCGGCDCYLL